MKKFLLWVVLAVAAAAATPLRAQVKVGLVGGLNVSKLSFDENTLKSSNRCGWYAGPKLWIKVPVVGLGADASVQYSTRRLNSKAKADGTDLTEQSKDLSTIEVPINVRYSVGMASVASVYVATGPQFGFNVGHKHITDYEFRKANVSWNVGAGLRLLGHLEVGAGYNIALSKFGKRYEGQNANDFKSNTWQVQAAYLF